MIATPSGCLALITVARIRICVERAGVVISLRQPHGQEGSAEDGHQMAGLGQRVKSEASCISPCNVSATRTSSRR